MQLRSMVTIKTLLFTLLTFACFHDQKQDPVQKQVQDPILDQKQGQDPTQDFSDLKPENRSEIQQQESAVNLKNQDSPSSSKASLETSNLESRTSKTNHQPTSNDKNYHQAKSSSLKVSADSTKLESGSTVKDTGSGTIANSVVDHEKIKNSETETGKLDHSLWNNLLIKHVQTSGKVNYKGFKSEISSLDKYLAVLKVNPVQVSWSRNEKMAYWINAYNAFTVKLIVQNYPLESITKLHGGKPWDVKWIEIGSNTYSLNEMENDILRPEFNDARIHFAVNCAAVSCPPLLNKAWTADNLESNFEKQAKSFINNPVFNKIQPSSIEVSKIFDWYGSDFGNLINYLNRYSETAINKNATIKYKEYDWSLNE